MEQQISQPTQPIMPAPEQRHGHKGLYTALVLSLGTSFILLIIVLSTLSKNQKTNKTQDVITQNQQTALPNQTKTQEVSPVPIATDQDLDNAVKVLDAADTAQINAGLDQISKDTSSFSQ